MTPVVKLTGGPLGLINHLAIAPREFAHSPKGSEMANKAFALVQKENPEQADLFLVELAMLGYNVTRGS